MERDMFECRQVLTYGSKAASVGGLFTFGLDSAASLLEGARPKNQPCHSLNAAAPNDEHACRQHHPRMPIVRRLLDYLLVFLMVK
jgi:hypothetical protein